MLYGELLASRERLLTPLVRKGARKSSPLVPASFDEAIARIVERVKPLRGDDILACGTAARWGSCSASSRCE